MNEKELERRLRTERSPREDGYVASQLPSTLEPPGGSGRSTLLRTAVILPAAAAGVLVVALASGILSRAEQPFGNASASPSATAISSPNEPAPCQVQDLSLVAEPWGGAAGSRGTVVTVALADGRPSCEVSTRAEGRILDAKGAQLTRGIVGPSRMWAVIDPGEAFTIGVAWSNWCSDPPPMPLTLEIGLVGVSQHMVLDGPDADGVPPCMGENVPTTLSVTSLQPAP